MKKVILAIIIITAFASNLSAQTIINERTELYETGTGTGVLKVYAGAKYYDSGAGWETIIDTIQTLAAPNDSGYSYGIWAAKNKIEFPDSLNSDLWIKISDGENIFAVRPYCIARYINGAIDVNNYIPFSNTVNGISVSGKSVTYSFGTGSHLKLSYSAGSIKQEVYFSEQDRRKLIQYIPAADYVGVAYQYKMVGEKYKITIDAGSAWTEDSTFYEVKDLFTTVNDKKFWLTGVHSTAFKDTANHPGAFTIDPVIQITPGTLDRWIGSPTGGTTNTNLAARSLLADTLTTLLLFPILGLPENATIESAIGSLYVHTKSSNITTYSSGLLVAFDESATWLTTDGATAWDRPGAYTVGTDILQFTDTTAISATGWASWDVTAYFQSVAGVDSTHPNYGITVGSLRDQDYGDGVFFGSPTYATAGQRPILYLEYNTDIPIVYAADSLAWGALTDTTAVLDSIACNPVDNTAAFTFSIYDTSSGLWLDTSTVAPFSTVRNAYKRADWKARTLNFPRDYETQFKVWSYAYNGTDSARSITDSLQLGTVGVTFQGGADTLFFRLYDEPNSQWKFFKGDSILNTSGLLLNGTDSLYFILYDEALKYYKFFKGDSIIQTTQDRLLDRPIFYAFRRLEDFKSYIWREIRRRI